MRLSGGKMRSGHAAQLGGAVFDPAQGLSHIGGPSMLPQDEYRGPYLVSAKALVPCKLQQGLVGTIAQICHPRALRTYPSLSRQSESIRLQHRQSDSIRVGDSLLHIITIYNLKDYIIFKSSTCTSRLVVGPAVLWTLCNSTHCTYRLAETAELLQCTEKSKSSFLAAFQPDFQAKLGILGQLHHYYLFFCIITIIITY